VIEEEEMYIYTNCINYLLTVYVCICIWIYDEIKIDLLSSNVIKQWDREVHLLA